MTERGEIYAPSDFRRVYVETQADLELVAEELAGAEAVGVDLEMGQRMRREMGGERIWSHVIALVQIASDHLSAVIDPLRCADLSPLMPLMHGPARKVFLGGGQDAALLGREDLLPRNVVDVGEVALGLFGRKQDGMAALALRIFGLTLDKTVRRTDWLSRPLNGGLITYAHRDAELTLLIYHWFVKHYSAELRAHEREYLEPTAPPGTPPWLQEAMRRSSQDLGFVLTEHGLDTARDQDLITREVGCALDQARSPRQAGRLMRIAGDLHLADLAPAVAQRASEPSSITRAAVARSLGAIGNPEVAGPVLDKLAEDPLEDVRTAVEHARKAMERAKAAPEDEEAADTGKAEESDGSLDDETRAALQRLLENLSAGESR